MGSGNILKFKCYQVSEMLLLCICTTTGATFVGNCGYSLQLTNGFQSVRLKLHVSTCIIYLSFLVFTCTPLLKKLIILQSFLPMLRKQEYGIEG